MKSIALVQTDDRKANQFQQNLKQAVDPLLQNPLLNGYIISGVTLASGDNTISHGLNRPLQGWVQVLLSAGVTLYDKQAENTTPSTTLIINSSGAATLSLYVF
jgi:hypothetical protein